MKKEMQLLLTILILIPMLAGCMYPEEKLKQNQVPYLDQLQAVQTAVDQYREKNSGLLPIKTREQSTPIYRKYPIDFKKLVPTYMEEPPGNAFESGGVFQYVLVDADTDPKVKVFDLRIAEMIRDIKLRIKSQGYPPYKEQIADQVYTIDFKKLGYQEAPAAQSPYSGRELPFIVTAGSAEIYVDYRSDLFAALEKSKADFKYGDDIRELLVADSAFVPAYSLPYTLDPKTKKPVFFIK